MKKKIFAFVLALCLVLGMTSVVFAAEGTMDDPKMFIYTGTPVEITLEAGETVFYTANNAFIGKTLVVSGSWDVMVQYGMFPTGPMPNGKIEFSLDMFGGTMFALINSNGEEAITVTVDVKQIEGTMDNPIVLEEDGWGEAEITPEREGMPVYYRYVAPEDGLVYVSVSYAYDSEDNFLGWAFCANNLTACQYGENHMSSDEEVVNEEAFEVEAGDVIEFYVTTYDPENPWNAPEGKVSFSVYFEGVVGSESNPIYLDTMSDDTVIPTGDPLHYMAYGIGGTTLEITGDVYVIYNGETYEAVDGVVTVDIEAAMFPMMPTYLQIGTNAEEEVAITFNISYPEGTYMNPDELEEGEQTVEIEEGGSEYYYTWVATEDGKLTIVITSEGGWMYAVNNMTAGIYGDTQWSDSDPVVNTVTIEVAEGDEIQLVVLTYNAEEPWAVPAGSVTVGAEFEANQVEDTEEGTEDEEIKDNGDATANMIAMIVLLGGALLVTGFVAKKRSF